MVPSHLQLLAVQQPHVLRHMGFPRVRHVIYLSNRNINIPSGKPWGFDSLTCPGRREFDIRSCYWGGEFHTIWEGWWCGLELEFPRFLIYNTLMEIMAKIETLYRTLKKTVLLYNVLARNEGLAKVVSAVLESKYTVLLTNICPRGRLGALDRPI